MVFTPLRLQSLQYRARGGGHRLDGHNSQVPVGGMQVVGKGLRIATPCTLRKPENHINQSCFR